MNVQQPGTANVASSTLRKSFTDRALISDRYRESIAEWAARPYRMRYLAMVSGIFAILLVANSAIGQQKESSGQLTELQRVQKISELTGRPIFAVAGRST